MYLKSKRLGLCRQLKPGKLLIGRRPNCDIVINERPVSGEHLHLEFVNNALRIRDDGSRNNTYVNDVAIRGSGWVDLKLGDKVTLCGYDLHFVEHPDDDRWDTSCVISASSDESYVSELQSKTIPLTSQQLQSLQQFTQIRALIEISQTLRDVLETEDVLERAVGILFQIFPAVERAAICFVNHEAHTLTPRWWEIREGHADTAIRISSHIGWHVVESRQALLSNNVLDEFSDALSLQGLPCRSVMCCPLMDASGDVFGFIYADASQTEKFTELDLEVLASVALQIALAINCARLHAIAIQDEVLRLDVERARLVQERYLPGEPPKIPGYDVAGFYRAARHVGGDYFDYVALPDNRYAIVLGDVVGKGVPAALTMVRLATETRSGIELTQSPCELTKRLSNKFAGDFITFIILLIDPSTHQISLCNAGHNAPLLRDVRGQIREVGSDISGCPLGVMPEETYETLQFSLAPGESLIIHSDGFPDAEHQPTGKRLGQDPINQKFASINGDAAEMIQSLADCVDEFVAGSPQFDDMCMVCIKRL